MFTRWRIRHRRGWGRDCRAFFRRSYTKPRAQSMRTGFCLDALNFALDFQEQAARIFQAFLDADQEGNGFAAINDAVVVGDGQVHHRADFDLAGDGDRAFLDFMHAQKGRLRRVEDGRAHQRAVDAAIGDGEGAAGEFFQLQRAILGAFGKAGNRGFDFGNGFLVGVADDGNDEAVRAADGDAHMHEVLIDDVVTVDLGIHGGELSQGRNDGFNEEAVEAEAHAFVLFLESFFVFAAQCHDGTHIDLVDGREHRRGVLRILEARGDGFAQPRHLDALFAGIRRARRLGGHGSRSGSGFVDEGEHVTLRDAAVLGGALADITGGEVLLLHELGGGRQGGSTWAGDRAGRRRRRVDARGGGSRRVWCRLRINFFRFFFFRGWFGARGINAAEQRTDFYLNAFIGDDLGDHAGFGRVDLDGDLGGLEFDDRFVSGHGFAGFLDPARDGCAGYALAKRRYFNVGSHNYS